MSSWFSPFKIALLCLLLTCAPALAAGEGQTVILADYWDGFLKYWKDTFQKQNGVTMGILLVGALSLFIITRGKWQK